MTGGLLRTASTPAQVKVLIPVDERPVLDVRRQPRNLGGPAGA
jgi:hypothetical protein